MLDATLHCPRVSKKTRHLTALIEGGRSSRSAKKGRKRRQVTLTFKRVQTIEIPIIAAKSACCVTARSGAVERHQVRYSEEALTFIIMGSLSVVALHILPIRLNLTP